MQWLQRSQMFRSMTTMTGSFYLSTTEYTAQRSHSSGLLLNLMFAASGSLSARRKRNSQPSRGRNSKSHSVR